MNKVETALRQITAADEVRYETDADLDAMVREYMKTPEDQVLEEEIQETLKKSFRKLSEKDLKLVFIAFGFEDGTPKSTNQVAKLAGLSVNETSKSIARSLRLLADDEDLMHLFGKSKSHKRKTAANKALTLSLIPNDNIMDLFENLDEEDDKKKMDQIPDTEYDGTFVIQLLISFLYKKGCIICSLFFLFQINFCDISLIVLFYNSNSNLCISRRHSYLSASGICLETCSI